MRHRATLPDLDTLNPEALKALIGAQHEQLVSKEEQLASRDEEIDRLKLLIAKLRRMKFGCKSEKLDRQIEQLELRLDELETSRAQQLAAFPAPLAASDVNRSAKHARKPLPAHLPRETHKILPKQEILALAHVEATIMAYSRDDRRDPVTGVVQCRDRVDLRMAGR